jgi:hypothetical protein
MTRPGRQQILALFDAGHAPRVIIAAGFDKHQVYRVLRRHRADRKRAPRTRTSNVPLLIRALDAEGLAVERIQAFCDCSRAYVYRHLHS